MSNKMTDELCQVCINYDECNLDSEKCHRYEYYKCNQCIDRLLENNNDIPRCFRGGIPCSNIKSCNNERKLE